MILNRSRTSRDTKFLELSHRTGDIIPLIRYVYGNTQIPDDEKTEPMKALLAEYISFEIDTDKGLGFQKPHDCR